MIREDICVFMIADRGMRIPDLRQTDH